MAALSASNQSLLGPEAEDQRMASAGEGVGGGPGSAAERLQFVDRAVLARQEFPRLALETR